MLLLLRPVAACALPQGAHEAAGGRLSFMVGLVLPPACPSLVIQGGVVHREGGEEAPPPCVTWPQGGRLRQVFGPGAVQGLLVSARLQVGYESGVTWGLFGWNVGCASVWCWLGAQEGESVGGAWQQHKWCGWCARLRMVLAGCAGVGESGC